MGVDHFTLFIILIVNLKYWFLGLVSLIINPNECVPSQHDPVLLAPVPGASLAHLSFMQKALLWRIMRPDKVGIQSSFKLIVSNVRKGENLKRILIIIITGSYLALYHTLGAH